MMFFSGLYETTPNANALNNNAEIEQHVSETPDEAQTENSHHAIGMKQSVKENQRPIENQNGALQKNLGSKSNSSNLDTSKIESIIDNKKNLQLKANNQGKKKNAKIIPEQSTRQEFLLMRHARQKRVNPADQIILNIGNLESENDQKTNIRKISELNSQVKQKKEKIVSGKSTRQEFFFVTHATKITDSSANQILVESNEYFYYDSKEIDYN